MFQRILLFSIFLIGTSLTTAIAQQKFGHLNSGNVLEQMPEVLDSDKKLLALDDSLGVVLDTMAARFKIKYDAALKAVNEGTMTKLQQDNAEKDLSAEQTKITEFQKSAQAFIAQKRQIFLAPVLDRLNTAIVAVGKEKGYSFIFDVSAGNLLYVTETDDVSDLVATKLGITLKK